jgi:hypothetical protein
MIMENYLKDYFESLSENSQKKIKSLKSEKEQNVILKKMWELSQKEKKEKEGNKEDIPEWIEKKEYRSSQPEKDWKHMINEYLELYGYLSSANKNHEMEVRFGDKKGESFSKNNYMDVIQKMKSYGFISLNETGMFSLRILSEYVDKKSNTVKMSNVRVEIETLENIQTYCKTNQIKEIFEQDPKNIYFTNKKMATERNDDYKLYPIYFNDFHFRVSYQIEEQLSPFLKNIFVNEWEKNKKTFRYLNRVRYIHPQYPIALDISIVKTSNVNEKGELIKTYFINDSNVFQNKENYEIELELMNEKVGVNTPFDTYEKIYFAFKKVILMVLSGLQKSDFPISYKEESEVSHQYMNLLFGNKWDISKPILPMQFIGPSSLPLQIENICEVDGEEKETIPNIRNNYLVTEKADGERCLLYINDKGKMYLINTNMKFIFVGMTCDQKEFRNSVLDGEYIKTNKMGNKINLFAAFDLYFINKENIRKYPFFIDDKKCRYEKLKSIVRQIKMVPFMHSGGNHLFRMECKQFYGKDNSIFDACNEILMKTRENRFEYFTDGLVFTPAWNGVCGNKRDEVGPLKKITWNYSLKWKPLHENTIDFYVSVIKKENQQDKISVLFENGTNMKETAQFTSYKTLQLCCSYNEKKHGSIYLQPCETIYNDEIPKANVIEENENEYRPFPFYPTEPFDIEAGICHLLLEKDAEGILQMYTQDREIIKENLIVEFSYDIQREKGWRWIPKKIRHDKTNELLKGLKNYGNAYHVANSNWKLIHYPITETMISTGMNIPSFLVSEDIYYNKPLGKTQTECLKNFHNLYVKKKIIQSISKQGDMLIDYACGKGGDLPKWINAKLSFVFGIDLFEDNIENRMDGACVRYLNAKRKNAYIPSALFVNGNSSLNIKNGNAMLNEKSIQVTKAIFGKIQNENVVLGKGVQKHFGIAQKGFQISSCQFAFHYFWESLDSLRGFLKNIAECTKVGGYFIGTCYDGFKIFSLLKEKQNGEIIQISKQNKKIWEIQKKYSIDTFENNSSCVGLKVDVYQDSINQTIPEYLVNFDYFNELISKYGFQLLSNEELHKIGLKSSSSNFQELYYDMMNEIKKNPYQKKEYGLASQMDDFEKKISFLNRYFIYKKTMEVDIDNIFIEESFQKELDAKLLKKANDENKNQIDLKPMIKKLNKTIKLEPENKNEFYDTTPPLPPQHKDANADEEKDEEEKEEKKSDVDNHEDDENDKKNSDVEEEIKDDEDNTNKMEEKKEEKNAKEEKAKAKEEIKMTKEEKAKAKEEKAKAKEDKLKAKEEKAKAKEDKLKAKEEKAKAKEDKAKAKTKIRFVLETD